MLLPRREFLSLNFVCSQFPEACESEYVVPNYMSVLAKTKEMPVRASLGGVACRRDEWHVCVTLVIVIY